MLVKQTTLLERRLLGRGVSLNLRFVVPCQEDQEIDCKFFRNVFCILEVIPDLVCDQGTLPGLEDQVPNKRVRRRLTPDKLDGVDAGSACCFKRDAVPCVDNCVAETHVV